MAKETEMSAEQLRRQMTILEKKCTKKRSEGIRDFALEGKILNLKMQLHERVKYEHLAR